MIEERKEEVLKTPIYFAFDSEEEADEHMREVVATTALAARDAYWQQHEHDMYESLESAHKEAMGEMLTEINRRLGEHPFQTGNDTQWDRGVMFQWSGIKKIIKEAIARFRVQNINNKKCQTKTT